MRAIKAPVSFLSPCYKKPTSSSPFPLSSPFDSSPQAAEIAHRSHGVRRRNPLIPATRASAQARDPSPLPFLPRAHLLNFFCDFSRSRSSSASNSNSLASGATSASSPRLDGTLKNTPPPPPASPSRPAPRHHRLESRAPREHRLHQHPSRSTAISGELRPCRFCLFST